MITTKPEAFECVASYFDGSGGYAQYVSTTRDLLVTELYNCTTLEVGEIIISELERVPSLDGTATADQKLSARFYATAEVPTSALASSAIWLEEEAPDARGPLGYYTYWPSLNDEKAFRPAWIAYRTAQGAKFHPELSA